MVSPILAIGYGAIDGVANGNEARVNTQRVHVTC